MGGPWSQVARAGSVEAGGGEALGVSGGRSGVPEGGYDVQARALEPGSQPGWAGQVVQLSPGAVQMHGGALDAAEIATITGAMETALAADSWDAVRARVQGQIAAPIVRKADERKAGTAEDMTGIGSQIAAGRFATAIKALQPKWAGLTPWWRAQKLYKAANAELEAVGVPGFMTLAVQDMTARGGFASWEWGFKFQKALLSMPALSDDDASELAQTTLHEARHAEQHFRIARYLAGQGKTAAEILAEDDIPPHIAQAALAKPLTAENGSQAELDEAAEWHQAMGADGAKNQAISNNAGAQVDELKARHAAGAQALAAFQADPTRANADLVDKARLHLEAQVSVVEAAYVAYRNIPYEKDANEVGVTANHACDQL